MGENGSGAVEDQLRRLYEDAEKQTAKGLESVVHRDAFGELLAKMTENVMGVTRIGNDAFDMAVRNLRLAGRRDIVKLATQLARTEDKLEQVLQEVEQLRDELAAERADAAKGTGNGGDGGGNGGDGGGSAGRSSRKRTTTRASS
jgi:hypothetical protein